MTTKQQLHSDVAKDLDDLTQSWGDNGNCWDCCMRYCICEKEKVVVVATPMMVMRTDDRRKSITKKMLVEMAIIIGLASEWLILWRGNS